MASPTVSQPSGTQSAAAHPPPHGATQVGQTMTEYVIVLSVITAGLVVALGALSGVIGDLFAKATGAF